MTDSREEVPQWMTHFLDEEQQTILKELRCRWLKQGNAQWIVELRSCNHLRDVATGEFKKVWDDATPQQKALILTAGVAAVVTTVAVGGAAAIVATNNSNQAPASTRELSASDPMHKKETDEEGEKENEDSENA